MNRQLGGKQGSETSDPSPLSLLVHAADAQHQRPPIKGAVAQAESRKAEGETQTHGLNHIDAPESI